MFFGKILGPADVNWKKRLIQMLEYIGARALIEKELRLTDFLVLLTTVANISKILSFCMSTVTYM